MSEVMPVEWGAILLSGTGLCANFISGIYRERDCERTEPFRISPHDCAAGSASTVSAVMANDVLNDHQFQPSEAWSPRTDSLIALRAAHGVRIEIRRHLRRHDARPPSTSTSIIYIF
jgi:hypothetical protein